MQEEFRIFFGTDLGDGSGWIVLAEMLRSLRCGCAKAPRLTCKDELSKGRGSAVR